MRFTTTKDNLLNGISTVQRAVALKSPLPTLSGILLELTEAGLKLTGTNLDLCITCEVTVDQTQSQPGSIVLPARYLSEIVRRLPDGPVHFLADLSSYTASLRYGAPNSGGRNQAKLNGMNPGDFQVLPSLTPKVELELDAAMFRDSIRQVVYAAGQDDLRPLFTGVLLEIVDHELRTVATDTHRLTMRRAEVPELEAQLTNIIVPAKALGELARILTTAEAGNVQIVMAENYVSFMVGRVQLLSRLIDGQYPDYRQVIPTSHKSRISRIDSQMLAQAVERAGILSRDDSPIVSFNLQGNRLLISANSQAGSVLEEIPAECDGDQVEITFNTTYILEALRGAASSQKDEAVALEFHGALGPLVIRPHANGDYLALILPVRLS
ncbi:MAG: DNA polymerase III subunit beta [Clostridia bacterium]|nr:DNA polymerase III subunit beta [Clostridia bacterium]